MKSSKSMIRIDFKDVLLDKRNGTEIANTELNKCVKLKWPLLAALISLFPLFSAPQHFVSSPPFSSPTASLFMALCFTPPNGY